MAPIMTDSSISEKDIPYGTGGKRPLLLDIVRPDTDTSLVRPVVIWVHGGGWAAGSRENPAGRELAAHGFVAASISYQFSDEATFPAQIHDVKAALHASLRSRPSSPSLAPTLSRKGSPPPLDGAYG